MSSRFHRAAVLAGFLCAGGPQTAVGNLYVQMFPLTGEIRLRNSGSTSIPFVFYSIRSPGGALTSSSSIWKSIADNYDVSGNRFIDPNHEWFKLSPPGSTIELSEGVVDDPGGRLLAMRSLSLGRVWSPHKVPSPDLSFDFRAPNGQPITVFGELALDGDYLANGTVNLVDYTAFWRPYFGKTSLLLGDGNINGVIDAADYVVWRDNLGKTLPLPPYGAGVGATAPHSAALRLAVPEPSTVTYLLACVVLTRCGGEGRVRCRRGRRRPPKIVA